MKDGFVDSGWIELIAVDGGCKRSYHRRYLKQSRSLVVIDLPSTLNPFGYFEPGRVHITSFLSFFNVQEHRNAETDDNFLQHPPGSAINSQFDW